MDPVTTALTSYGAVGLLAILGLLGVRFLYLKLAESHAQEVTRLADSLARETQRADRLEQDLGRLNEAVRGGYINALTQSAQAISDANRTVADVIAVVRSRS